MIQKTEFWNIEYTDFGSLDMACDFCDKNSYGKNFHIRRNRNIELVICEKCLNKIKENSKE